MKHTVAIVVLVALLAGCRHRNHAQPQEQHTVSSGSEWKQGDVVELAGKIRPARTDAKYFIETADGLGVSIRSEAIDKLDAGTELWVKGKIEYVRHPKPKDYREEKVGEGKVRVSHGVNFPQTTCYINVMEHKIRNPEQSISSD